ncbi:Uncharacterised protein [Acinetobacter phage MD-2021a]|nr:Uncharacterised protein [Acinetobacter phage MD-2021a]CAH1088908.1 Uncharacterised protein [Acinetobacter phage MD-2021a]
MNSYSFEIKCRLTFDNIQATSYKKALSAIEKYLNHCQFEYEIIDIDCQEELENEDDT